MSMDAFHRALYAFWRGVEVNGTAYPVYMTGTVPEDAAFPYITFDVLKPAAFGQAALSATIWHRMEDGDSKNAARAAFLDAAAAAIPETGARLEWDGGFCMLFRSSGDFLSLMTDEEDKSVIGGRVGYEATFYDM